MHGLIHRSLHKRIKQKLPINSSLVFILEKVTIAAGVIGPLMVIPQIFKIYAHHNATGVLALSWIAFGILDIPFVLYGVVHKERPIVITYSLWLVANFIVAFGAIIYG